MKDKFTNETIMKSIRHTDKAAMAEAEAHMRERLEFAIEQLQNPNTVGFTLGIIHDNGDDTSHLQIVGASLASPSLTLKLAKELTGAVDAIVESAMKGIQDQMKDEL